MSRLVKTMLTSLVILILFGMVIFIIIFYQDEDKPMNMEEYPVEKAEEYSYETSDLTTDLDDGRFVRIQFQILTNSKEAKEEVSNREFQLKNILIKELSTMAEEDFKTESGLTELEEQLTERLNELMTEGKIIDVYTVDKILQ